MRCAVRRALSHGMTGGLGSKSKGALTGDFTTCVKRHLLAGPPRSKASSRRTRCNGRSSLCRVSLLTATTSRLFGMGQCRRTGKWSSKPVWLRIPCMSYIDAKPYAKPYASKPNAESIIHTVSMTSLAALIRSAARHAEKKCRLLCTAAVRREALSHQAPCPLHFEDISTRLHSLVCEMEG